MLLFVLALTTSGFAQETKEKVVYQARTEIDFEGVDVEGELIKPEGSFVIDRQRARFTSMIRLRTNFNSEIRSSIQDIE